MYSTSGAIIFRIYEIMTTRSMRRVVVLAMFMISVGIFTIGVIIGENGTGFYIAASYAIAGFVCHYRISMFSLKIDCFLQPSNNTLQEWKIVFLGWLVAALVATAVSAKSPSGIGIGPLALLLWLFVVKSFAWHYTLNRKRTLTPLLCDRISNDLNPTQIAVFSTKQLYLWLLLAVLNNDSPKVLCAHLMAYTEVLHSFKSLVFVSRVFESIQDGGQSTVVLLTMSFSFVTALALFLAALHFKSVGDDSGSFILFITCTFLFAVPEICADLYVLQMWTDPEVDTGSSDSDDKAEESREISGSTLALATSDISDQRINNSAQDGQGMRLSSSGSLAGRAGERIGDTTSLMSQEDDAREWMEDVLLAPAPTNTGDVYGEVINNSDLMSGRIDWQARVTNMNARTSQSTENRGWARALFSTEKRGKDQSEGQVQVDGMLKAAKALSISVCILSVLLALFSGIVTLRNFRSECQQGPDAFYKKRQVWVKFASVLHSDQMNRCSEVWPQLCQSSCKWGHGLLHCDSSSRPTNLTMMGLQLSGNISYALRVLSEFNTLEEVDLSYNKLVGSIPAQLSSLSALDVLNLGNNALTGTIPVQLSSLSALDVLDLSSNALTGTIPAQLSSLSGLTIFDLSYNTLRGPIPSSLGSLTALQVLRLNNNAIVGGTIPAGVPSANFNHRRAWENCEMQCQCSACSDKVCCSDGANDNDNRCADNGAKRLDTPMCRACGYYSTGLCLVSNTCSNITRSKNWCDANCTNTAGSSIYEAARMLGKALGASFDNAVVAEKLVVPLKPPAAGIPEN
jgi:hypothetical protein